MKLKITFLLLFISYFNYSQTLYSIENNYKVDKPIEKLLELKKRKNITNEPINLFLIGLNYEYLNKDDSAFVYYKKAKKEFTKQKKTNLSKELDLYFHALSVLDPKNPYGTDFLKSYSNFAEKSDNQLLKSIALKEKADLVFFIDPHNKNAIKEARKNYQKALTFLEKINEYDYTARIIASISNLKNLENQIDSCKYFANKAIEINKKYNNNDLLVINYINLGLAYREEKDYKKALEYFKLAEKINIPKYENKTKLIVYKRISEIYDYLNDNENYIKYKQKIKNLEYLLDEENLTNKLLELQTLHNLDLKEDENDTLKGKLQKNYIIQIILLLSLISFAGVAYLFYKNQLRKKTIAEQKQELEIKKLEKTLKEHELHEIDIMLDTQAKERQRLANDLHDNLGSLMATIKINFENIKKNTSKLNPQEKNIYDKTDELINEAYLKIRNISHVNNLGVVGNLGLEISVKNMAEKMSVFNKIQFNVIPYGLNKRMNNAIEVTIFRIIQELCTNIIKHSKATYVNIYLTQHNNTDINLIIEDNGVGINLDTIKKSDGIGLKNIEKKVEQLKGTFTIDSIKGNGTTIIIDIPL